jgi:hypothetical protein
VYSGSRSAETGRRRFGMKCIVTVEIEIEHCSNFDEAQKQALALVLSSEAKITKVRLTSND